MNIIAEIFLGYFFEVIIVLVAEILFQGLAYSLLVTLSKEAIRRDPLIAVGGYLLWGGVIGLLSLYIFPAFSSTSSISIVIYIIITPLLSGFILDKLGTYRGRKGGAIIRIDSITYGAILGLGMVVVRLSNYLLTKV